MVTFYFDWHSQAKASAKARTETGWAPALIAYVRGTHCEDEAEGYSDRRIRGEFSD
jgi:hypothetical protein